ncbi:FliA/WhiG family RNA polymerase sigma factor [Cellulomonas sp. 73-145]|uniref:FliA/WhiG family RNA polymerase sigma factor n=1 Tax=unclassified Cellulomonas TaxID=2620175 RepID=UPI000ADA5958|nr:FliA/WhiG family RNA polymerase sigma factor [Cellulomonas sp. 73-145]MBN9326132.1 FliA/WhiG family RNA polymerase sigma factor [Cellulomonas sp.]
MTTPLSAPVRSSVRTAEPADRYAAGTAPQGVIPQQRSVAAGTAVPTGPVADAVLDLEATWVTFKDTGCPQARERLIMNFVPLVTAVAGRVGMRLPSMVEHADLVSYGMFGLIDAIEKYELGRSVKFESYASSRIRGAIIDELRAMDWVPRSVRTKARAVDRAYGELEATLHRSPSEHEVAGHLQMPVEELRSVLGQLSSVNVAALDEMLGGDDRPGSVSLGDTLGDERSEDPARSVEAQETKFLLARAIEQLGERERMVVVLYYYEGMTLAEIGRLLGVTESRISQMHTAAMARLRTRLVEAERA